jgi:hypothetical protein
LPAEDEDKVTVEIRVTGMNGMKVDGKLYRQGSVALSTVEPGRRMKLSFWGWDAQLVVAESEVSLESEDDGLSDGEDESRWRASSPPSSGDDEPAPSRRAGSSPSSATSLSAANLPSAPRASSPALSDISSVSSTPSRREAFDRASALVSSLNLDLPGLIASAIVFHPRATVAVDEITRALLRETGSLWRILGEGEDEEEIERTQEREDEAVKAWREVVEDVLTEEEMFGAIDNSGLKVRRFVSSLFLTSSSSPSSSRFVFPFPPSRFSLSRISPTDSALFPLTSPGRRRSTRPLSLLLLPRRRPLPRSRRRPRAVRQARPRSSCEGRCAVLLGEAEFEEEQVNR